MSVEVDGGDIGEGERWVGIVERCSGSVSEGSEVVGERSCGTRVRCPIGLFLVRWLMSLQVWAVVTPLLIAPGNASEVGSWSLRITSELPQLFHSPCDSTSVRWAENNRGKVL